MNHTKPTDQCLMATCSRSYFLVENCGTSLWLKLHSHYTLPQLTTTDIPVQYFKDGPLIENMVFFSSRTESSAHSRKHQKFLSKVPCTTNTTLNVLRVFGRYNNNYLSLYLYTCSRILSLVIRFL